MGDPKGFLKIQRETGAYRPVCERIEDHNEVAILRPEARSKEQASRCMDCGTPFCNWGCPIGNYIPEWNDAMFHGHWEKAIDLLHATNNFPEITGRICPALCEYACVLGINDEPVTIRENELAIIERAFKAGRIKPRQPLKRTGKSVAIVGSGPAGLAAADQLNKAGHRVTIFERDDRAGGILRYGIPEFKLPKAVIDRRINVLKKSGITFSLGVNVGKNIKISKLRKEFDAICLTGGSRVPRDLKIEGRELRGIHFAMDYLIQKNKIDAKDKRVVIIGGGDTGADCVGTAHRQGASCVVQIEVLPRPPEYRPQNYPWPKYPILFKTTTSHEEGGDRHWEVSTKRFIGVDGQVTKMLCAKPGSEFDIDADLVILAIGFLHPEHSGPVKELGLELDSRGNVKTGADYMTSVKGIFSAGDMRRGQSLVVWAIAEGRRSAHYIDKYLMGQTNLPAI